MKKMTKLLLVACLLVLALLAVTACSKDGTLSIKEGKMPQLVHVQGEELNLSSGVLLFDTGDAVEEIAMDAEGVEVTGYDRNTLGEQTLTITYKESSVTIKVNVVPRMTIFDYTTDYLVGDSFDTANGSLKITRNNGTSFSVILKSDKVSIEGFDSSEDGNLSLKAKYTNSGVTYECDFGVAVYPVEDITFKAPTKPSYNSHEATLDVSGGYFTLVGKGGALKRDIPLTVDNVSGFDITVVNENNRETNQTLTVVYGENVKTFTYTVKLVYTSVSEFIDNADNFKKYAWEGEEDPDIDDADGEKAISLMGMYFNMAPSEQSKLTRSDLLNVARTAFFYGYTEWYTDLVDGFDGVFYFDDYGNFQMDCADKAKVSAAINEIKKADRPIYEYYDVLNNMIDLFAEEVLFTYTSGEYAGEAMFGNYTVIDPEAFEELGDLFSYMIDLDEIASDVGADWKDDISKYDEQIENVFEAITESDYYNYDFSQYFYYVSMWRDGDDLFDFLYNYYYSIDNSDAILQIANIRLPSKLEEIYVYVYEAMSLMSYLADTESYYWAEVPDASQFFYSYYMAMTLTQNLFEGIDEENMSAEDEMHLLLFYYMPLNSMLGISTDEGIYYFSDMLAYLVTGDGGYNTLCGSLLDLPEFDTIMEKYFEVIVKAFEDESYDGSAECIADAKELFKLYMQLDPSEQFSFLGVLSTYYVRGYMPLAFDNTGDYAGISTMFVDIINKVYTGMFETEAGKDAYLQLILATEIYAQRYIYSTINGSSSDWLTAFSANLAAVKAILEGSDMSAADKELFNAELGAIYNKYNVILNSYTASSPDSGSGSNTGVDLGEWADEFAELEEAVLDLELAYAILSEGANYYDMFFSAFERVWSLSLSILGSGDEFARNLFIYSELYSTSSLDRILDEDFTIDPEDEVFWTYDYVLSVYRSMYINALMTMGIYDYYVEYGMVEFMDMAYDVIWAYMGAAKDADDIFDKDLALAVMKKFSEMDVTAQVVFAIYIEGEYGIYYTAISEFFKEEFSVDVASVAELLVNMEMEAIIYKYYASYIESDEITADDIVEYAEAFVAAYDEVMTEYNKLDATEKEEFNAAFSDILAIYTALVNEINAPAAN